MLLALALTLFLGVLIGSLITYQTKEKVVKVSDFQPIPLDKQPKAACQCMSFGKWWI